MRDWPESTTTTATEPLIRTPIADPGCAPNGCCLLLQREAEHRPSQLHGKMPEAHRVPNGPRRWVALTPARISPGRRWAEAPCRWAVGLSLARMTRPDQPRPCCR